MGHIKMEFLCAFRPIAFVNEIMTLKKFIKFIGVILCNYIVNKII